MATEPWPLRGPSGDLECIAIQGKYTGNATVVCWHFLTMKFGVPCKYLPLKFTTNQMITHRFCHVADISAGPDGSGSFWDVWRREGCGVGPFFLFNETYSMAAHGPSDLWNIWIILSHKLVGGLEHFFPYLGNVIIPIDELIFFRGVGQPPTSHGVSKSQRIKGGIGWWLLFALINRYGYGMNELLQLVGYIYISLQWIYKPVIAGFLGHCDPSSGCTIWEPITEARYRNHDMCSSLYTPFGGRYL